MNVKRDGTNNGSLTEQPEKRHQTYNKLLPNAGLNYQLDERDQLFYSLSRNMRIPQNYVLYDKGVTRSTPSRKPAGTMSWAGASPATT
jgi:iron complex outermembrane receptor protein